jgi:hypothetical protein
MSNLQVTREKLPTGTAEPQISGFFSKLLKVMSRDGKDWLVLNQTKEELKMAPAYDKKTNSPM